MALREGNDYKFVATALGLKKSLKADFKLAGTDGSGKYYEWNIINAKISSDKKEDFIFHVRLKLL